MKVDRVSETVTVVRLPNFEERRDISAVQYIDMRRHNEKVNFEPCLHPVHFKDTIICYKDCTKKRYVSNTYYEPRVKPKKFAETVMIFPKRPEKVFSTCLDYHIEECRKWFKTSMEFKAKTYTTSRIVMENNKPENRVSDRNANYISKSVENGPCVPEVFQDNKTSVSKMFQDNGPGASQVFLPRFNKDIYDDDDSDNDDDDKNLSYQNHYMMNGDLHNVPIRRLQNQHV